MRNMRSGRFALSSIPSSGQVTLIHGGAGPADPKGPQAEAAHAAICEIVSELRHGRFEQSELPRFLSDASAPRTNVELVALHAARLLENHPRFNAGYGSALQMDGRPRVSASFMESTRQKFSAVMNASDVLHPSELACYLQSERFPVLDSTGADNLARDLGIPRTNLITPERFQRWLKLREESLRNAPAADGKGTIGCVSANALGQLAAVTSTGGVGNETVGRVGDSPTVAGNYCSDRVAVSCTGYGEQILNLAFSARIATRLADGQSLDEAMSRGLAEAEARGYEFAAIAVAFDAVQKEIHWATGTTEAYFVWAALLPEKTVTFRDPA